MKTAQNRQNQLSKGLGARKVRTLPFSKPYGDLQEKISHTEKKQKPNKEIQNDIASYNMPSIPMMRYTKAGMSQWDSNSPTKISTNE